MTRRIWSVGFGVLGVALIAAGVIVSQQVVILSNQISDETLRCGSAFSRDEDAAAEYATSRLAEAIGSKLTTGLAPAADYGGADLGKALHLDLDAECANALAAKRVWSIGSGVAGFAFLVAAALLWRSKPGRHSTTKNVAKRIVEGARFPRWMRECPDWATVVLTLAAGFTGLFTSIYFDRARLIWFAITAGLVFLAGLIAIARDDERRRQQRWIEAAETSHQEALQALLGNQLYHLIELVAEAVSTEIQAERKKLAHSARVAIIAAAANLVGQKAVHGTRANLFKLAPDLEVMALEPGCFSGRGERSRRTFQPGHETYDATMNRKGVFVADVGEVKDVDQGPYETYITYPVHVPSHVHGVLTVDCLHKGELAKKDDVPMMSVLACLIAITYECEKYPRPRV